MDVFSNIAFPLRMRRRGRAEIKAAVRTALDIVRLPDIQKRQIHELSGGQQQRVAIARALVYQPDLLLLDEPFGALDRRLREEMQLEIVRLHRELDVTIINVTHDQREALMLSDRIAVLNLGCLEQLASSEDVYRRPVTEFVAQFLGDANLVRGRVGAAGLADHAADPKTLRVGDLSLTLPEPVDAGTCILVIKSEALEVVPTGHVGSSGEIQVLDGTVALRVYEGGAVYYEVDVPSLDMRFKASQSAMAIREMFPVGAPVCVRWDPADTAVVVATDEG
jgi:putative spermidine/putrescine transport system ATP-binding protein